MLTEDLFFREIYFARSKYFFWKEPFDHDSIYNGFGKNFDYRNAPKFPAEGIPVADLTNYFFDDPESNVTNNELVFHRKNFAQKTIRIVQCNCACQCACVCGHCSCFMCDARGFNLSRDNPGEEEVDAEDEDEEEEVENEEKRKEKKEMGDVAVAKKKMPETKYRKFLHYKKLKLAYEKSMKNKQKNHTKNKKIDFLEKIENKE